MHLRHSHDRSQMDGHMGLSSWVLCGESRVKNLQGSMYDDFSVQDKFNTCKNDFKKLPLAFVRPYFVIEFSYVHGIA